MQVNKNYQRLEDNYLFKRIGEKVAAYTKANPEKKVIRMGIGDVTLPLAPAVVQAMQDAVAEMGNSDTFRGYEDNCGYSFLKEAICGYYASKGVELDGGEVFVSDGSKCDVANILDIFANGSTALVPDPVYPVYVDTNIMAGNKIVYAQGSMENGFLPMPSEGVKADIIYICSPNNPTGAVYNKAQLKAWVDYALAQEAIILYDAAYEAFVQDDLPTSIYQIPGAKDCAIETASLSKTAGFTGTRCAYAIVPSGLERGGVLLNKLWRRRQATKFNGVAYVVQRGAAAVFSPEGRAQCKANIAYYLENAAIISAALSEMGIWHTGGKNSPYIWLKCGCDSWQFFDRLLEEANVVGTPGAGFGAQGEGYFRLSAFGSRNNTLEAMERVKRLKIT